MDKNTENFIITLQRQNSLLASLMDSNTLTISLLQERDEKDKTIDALKTSLDAATKSNTTE